jgi:hypothetical protein
LLATLNQLSLQQPQSTSDWFLDTGASVDGEFPST